MGQASVFISDLAVVHLYVQSLTTRRTFLRAPPPLDPGHDGVEPGLSPADQILREPRSALQSGCRGRLSGRKEPCFLPSGLAQATGPAPAV